MIGTMAARCSVLSALSNWTGNVASPKNLGASLQGKNLIAMNTILWIDKQTICLAVDSCRDPLSL